MSRVTGGPAEGVRQINPFLNTEGHSTVIVSFDDSSEAGRDCAGEFVPLGREWKGPYRPALVRWLRPRLAHFDCVLVHGLWQMASTVSRVVGRTIPYFVFPHGMLDPWFRQAYPLKHLKKEIYWLLFEHAALARSSGVFFTTEEERRISHGTFWPYRLPERVVNYGIRAPLVDRNAALRKFHEQFPGLKEKRVLLFLSRFHYKKGGDLALQAFAGAVLARREKEGAFPFHFLLAGPEEAGEKKRLERMVKALPPQVRERITFSDGLFGDLKWGAFAAGDAFILPSHQENFGIAVAEALAMGMPVLISNKVNIHREITGMGAGWADEDNLSGTRRSIEKWIAQGGTTNEGRERARLCFDACFNLDRTADLFIKTLRACGVRG